MQYWLFSSDVGYYAVLIILYLACSTLAFSNCVNCTDVTSSSPVSICTQCQLGYTLKDNFGGSGSSCLSKLCNVTPII